MEHPDQAHYSSPELQGLAVELSMEWEWGDRSQEGAGDLSTGNLLSYHELCDATGSPASALLICKQPWLSQVIGQR